MSVVINILNYFTYSYYAFFYYFTIYLIINIYTVRSCIVTGEIEGICIRKTELINISEFCFDYLPDSICVPYYSVYNAYI